MVVVRAERELLAPKADVWALVSQPYHLPDWWPGYTGVEPDRRGLAEGARWTVMRSRTPGLLRRPSGQGVIVLRRVDPTLELRWLDVAQQIEAGVELANAGSDRTRAVVSVEGAWWRVNVEGARRLPHQALSRLYDLCQTASQL